MSVLKNDSGRLESNLCRKGLLKIVLASFSLALIGHQGFSATVTWVGAEEGSAGNGYSVQNWSNPGLAKAYDLGGSEKYGVNGYYQIRPTLSSNAVAVTQNVSAGNNLGITETEGSNPTLYSAPVFLNSSGVTGGAGTFVNYGGYALYRGPDGSTLYRQGGLSVSTSSGPYNTPSGSNNGYFGNAFSFTMATNMAADFRLGVAVDSVGSSSYAPDYVSIYNSSIGSTFSTKLPRNGSADMVFFDVNANAGESFTAAMWQLAGSNSVAPVSLITFDVSRYKFDVANGQTTTNSVALSGTPAALVKTGDGTLVVTSSNTYGGGTTISAGTLKLQGGSVTGNITNNGNLSISAALANSVSGTGSLTKEGSGIAELWSSNTYTGPTVINAGQLMIAGANGAISTNSEVQIASGASLRLDGYYAPVDTNRTIGGLTGAGVLFSSGGTVTVNKTSGTNIFSGDIQGGQGLIKSGAGTLVLSGSNSYTGLTTINGGTLQIGNGGTDGSLGRGDVVNNGNLALAISNTVTISNAISGSGTLNSGGVTMILAGNNSYSGLTTVSAGILAISNNSALGSTAAGTIVNSGAGLRLHGVTVGNEALTISGAGPAGTTWALRTASGNNTWGGQITLAADATIQAASGTGLTLDVGSGDAVNLQGFTATFNGAGTHNVYDAVGGTGGIIKAGTGILNLTASNSYSGGTGITDGRLVLSGAGRLGAGAITVSSGTANAFELAVTGTNLMANNISGSGKILSSSGLTELNGAVTSTGGLTVNSSTVRVGSSGSITAATTVNSGGALDVAGSAGSVTVNSGGTLKGDGTVSALTIATGGTLAVGNSPGQLDVTGNAQWAGGGIYSWEFDSAAGNNSNPLSGQGVNWDFLNVAGELNITADSSSKFIIDVVSLLALNDTSFDLNNNYSFAIATAAGGITSFLASDFNITGYQATATNNKWSIDRVTNGNGTQSLVLSYTGATAIPEPSTAALTLAGMGVLTLFNRRRRCRITV